MDSAGLACRCDYRLEQGGFQAIGDPRSSTDANEQARAEKCHRRHLEVGLRRRSGPFPVERSNDFGIAERLRTISELH